MKIFKPFSKPVVVLPGMLCALSFLLTSCLKTTYQPVNTAPVALVTFIQASPDEPSLSLYLDNNRVSSYYFQYGDVLNYFRAYPGKRNVHFYNQGTMNQVFGDTVTLTANMNYSLFLANKPSQPEIVLLKDTINQPATGKAGIRFVNMSPDSPPVSLAIRNGQVLATSVPYKGATTFVPVQGNTSYNFEVRQGTTNTVLATLGYTLNAGSVYTIWFHGLNAPTGTSDTLSADIYLNAYFYY